MEPAGFLFEKGPAGEELKSYCLYGNGEIYPIKKGKFKRRKSK